MSAPFTDLVAARLIAEPKPITRQIVAAQLVPSLQSTRKSSRQGAYEVTGDYGHEFKVIVRENQRIPKNFSVILASLAGNKAIRLVRCQGHHQPHTNHLEKKSGIGLAEIPWNTCHVHRYTERYFDENPDKHDEYAEPTTAYATWQEALQYLLNLANFCFTDESGQQLLPLFPDTM